MASFFLSHLGLGGGRSADKGNPLGSLAIEIPDDDDKPNLIPDNYYSLQTYSAAVLFEVFLYGIYSTLFAICIRVLLRNRRTTQKILLACAVVMFCLATVDVILELSFLFRFVVQRQNIPEAEIHYKYLIYITSNIIADSLVIYRCHAVWNNSKRVILLPCFLLVCGSACGYAFIAVSQDEYKFRKLLVAFLFSTVTLNMLVTMLMAGRIWWIARKARAILGPGLSSKYNTMIAIIVESGIIYSIYVILDVVFPNLILDAGLAQVVGIVPTLIIVQIGMGRESSEVDHASTSVMRTTTRGFTTTVATTHELGYDVPPSGSPPPMSATSLTQSIPSPLIPPLSFPAQSRLVTRHLEDQHRRMEEDSEYGFS
ncbi:hypothetical protein CVT24_005606 [Panaeolus cyanescens]|uniref:Uncharacterized protein n=1 Tax=Panaeolus cyanescens TaxID=181874 RepID=A0A409YY04_9AGAR|nr:hypothetical protein CVT24_005606 [Panaeolus cyanescens]